MELIFEHFNTTLVGRLFGVETFPNFITNLGRILFWLGVPPRNKKGKKNLHLVLIFCRRKQILPLLTKFSHHNKHLVETFFPGYSCHWWSEYYHIWGWEYTKYTAHIFSKLRKQHSGGFYIRLTQHLTILGVLNKTVCRINTLSTQHLLTI